MRENGTVSGTVGVTISPRTMTVATLCTTEDGTGVPSSVVRAVGPDEPVGAGLAAALDEMQPAPSRVVADIGPVLDHWVTQLSPGGASPSPIGKVTVVRVSPTPVTVATPFDGWPERLGHQVDGGWVHLAGGVDLHGGRVIPEDTSAIDDAIRLAERRGSAAICVSGMGALLDSEVEHRVAEHLLRAAPGCRVVLAHETGGRRFLEREKSAILAASLLPATSALLDDLETGAARAGCSLSLVGADGARLGVEDARALPTRLLGSTNGLVAQGAAAVAGVPTAVIVVWVGDHARLLTIEQGVLRARTMRRSARLGDLRFSQRHAVESILKGPAVAALTRDLVDDRPVVLTQVPTDHDAADGFQALTSTLAAQLPHAHMVRQEAATLAALGARASLPQSEIVRYAVVSGRDEVEQVRHFLLQIAQGRVLAAADGPVELRTIADHYSPLSFLTAGPVLLRAHVVGFPTDAG